MARPHIEFVQTQNVAWQGQADGTRIKWLNGDLEGGEETILVHYPAGFLATGEPTGIRAEEFFVLEGSVTSDLGDHGYHAYGFLPCRSGLAIRGSHRGGVVLLFRHGRDDPHSAAPVSEPVAIDTARMAWDTSIYDPALNHLHLARKVLRLGPGDSGRTFLLTGLPHGVPDTAGLPSEHHDHAEEMFMIHGEMWAPEGRMAAGAYFYRPPGIEHGPHVSETGFLQIMRSPGANRIVTHWSERLKPLPLGATHAPVLPPGCPEGWAQPWSPAEMY